MANNNTDYIFLPIDSVEERMQEYCDLLNRKKGGHTVLFHGETGTGKSMFSSECIKKIKEQDNEILIIDLINQLQTSSLKAEDKLEKLLEVIEDELGRRSGYESLKGNSGRSEIFKRNLDNILKQRDEIILIRFPKIETHFEFEKYYSYLHMENTILYFLTDIKDVTEECKKKYDVEIEYYECLNLKSGDGKLFIENIFIEDDSPKFVIEDIESLMELRPQNKKMTIKELKSLCIHVYRYAQKTKQDYITKEVIAEELATRGIV